MSTEGETKESTVATPDTDDREGVQDLITLSFVSQLVSHNKRVSLLRTILSFHETKGPKDYIELRSSSKLFHRALSQPPPLWTTFPHSKYATLQSLLDRFKELHGGEESSGNVPSLLFIDEGVYEEEVKNAWTAVRVKIPLSIIGAGREKTTLQFFGMSIEGKKSDGIVEISDLKIKKGKRMGLLANRGMSAFVSRCSVEECQFSGVCAINADISCDNLQVFYCHENGVLASNHATITLSGEDTRIEQNVQDGMSNNFGLKTCADSAKIQLVAPLTARKISKNNYDAEDNGGGNVWGLRGTIVRVSKPRSKTTKNDFFIGQKCCCRWESIFGTYYNCEILDQNEDGTYFVDYYSSDGRVIQDSSVEWQRLHKDPN